MKQQSTRIQIFLYLCIAITGICCIITFVSIFLVETEQTRNISLLFFSFDTIGLLTLLHMYKKIKEIKIKRIKFY